VNSLRARARAPAATPFYAHRILVPHRAGVRFYAFFKEDNHGRVYRERISREIAQDRGDTCISGIGVTRDAKIVVLQDASAHLARVEKKKKD